MDVYNFSILNGNNKKEFTTNLINTIKLTQHIVYKFRNLENHNCRVKHNKNELLVMNIFYFQKDYV
jgi:hypothetical protein